MEDKKFKKIVVLAVAITFIIAIVAVPNINIFKDGDNFSSVRASDILNRSPSTPSKPSGPISGIICEEYYYSTSSDDPEGLNISYGWDWDGDLEIDEWTGFYEPNETCNISHYWTDPGEFNISVIANNSMGNLSDWSEALIVEMINLPPNEPSEPDPDDGEGNVDVEKVFSWEGGDPNICDTVTYDVYFGQIEPLEKVASNLTNTSFTPDDLLAFNTTYLWLIVAWDNHNESTDGRLWNFITRDNNPPDEPNNPSPADGANNIDINEDLNWSCSDQDGDDLFYDIYFGTNSNPPLDKSDHPQEGYDPGPMDFNTTYYWKIVAKDKYGESTEGLIWDFTTESSSSIEVEIIKPAKNKFYLRGIEILTLPFSTIVYGPIKIIANVSSEAEIEKVEFYIDGKYKGNDTEAPYEYNWAGLNALLSGRYKIEVIAYDVSGGNDSAEVTVIKWRAHPGLLLAAGGLVVLKQKIMPTKRTYVRGTVFNLRRVGKTYHCRAIRLHYTEFSGLTRTSGIIKLQRVSFKHGPLLRKYDIGPLGLTTYIAGVIPGDIL